MTEIKHPWHGEHNGAGELAAKLWDGPWRKAYKAAGGSSYAWDQLLKQGSASYVTGYVGGLRSAGVDVEALLEATPSEDEKPEQIGVFLAKEQAKKHA